VPVLDASVVVDCVAPDVTLSSRAVRTLARLSAEGAELVGPRLLLSECSNALLMGIRKGRWTGAAADQAKAQLSMFPVKLADDAQHLDRAWELSRRYDNHPIYDMVYVAIAEAAGIDLITADETLLARLAHLGWVKPPDL
jgi:predicted nucleic acid-binding protein